MKTVCLVEFDTFQEAQIAKNILEEKNIVVLFPNEHIVGAFPFYSGATGGFKIYVSKNRYETAREILQSAMHAVTNRFVELEGIEEETGLECPHCGEHSLFEKIKFRKILIIFLFFLGATPIPAKYKRYVCKSCGAKEPITNENKSK